MTEPTGDDPRDALRTSLGSFSTEGVNPATTDLDLLPLDEQVALMCAENAVVPDAVTAQAPQIAAAIELTVAGMREGGRIVYVGAGTPGRLGVLDASEIPPTYGMDPSRVVGVISGGDTAIRTAVENAEDDDVAGAAAMDELAISGNDTVIGISASGRTPYVLGALNRARERGAATVGFACNTGSPIGAASDVAIETVVGPEVVTGSTRLKAGTAQKLVLNTISTLTMVRLGKVYGNLMVDVRATNEKLRARSERIVMLATGTDAVTAASALAAVDGWVKAAILVVVTGLAGDEAVRLLHEHDGMLREAVAAAS
ncbi:N-acetylmuramic acid 6-phosphate etherase [Humibacter ginsenosidimutans]|uniref:N-acetylmuramic acid 6-phosphate etherase n=1 Tax=Humibacter ginsenosidimutans TaxID=2599293 RepID=A0A5B8M4Z2_9MICO|nr:N-acetylmuramic acid 6-phosphate etherase [Humibacter ginsenosidimutans]QDZ14885.1 N-acetylmuramic acid 6-phosphate etherase [Humibacter ginsenosidimutans]